MPGLGPHPQIRAGDGGQITVELHAGKMFGHVLSHLSGGVRSLLRSPGSGRSDLGQFQTLGLPARTSEKGQKADYKSGVPHCGHGSQPDYNTGRRRIGIASREFPCSGADGRARQRKPERRKSKRTGSLRQ